MEESNLEEATLEAQRAEMERKQRLAGLHRNVTTPQEQMQELSSLEEEISEIQADDLVEASCSSTVPVRFVKAF